jgi:hypothetical protein
MGFNAARVSKLGCVGSHAHVQVGELSEHFAVFRIQALNKGRIIEPGLAIRFAQITQGMQTLHDRLAARRRQLLPARNQILLNLPLLRGGELFPNLLPIAQVLLLRWGQPVPGLETLTNPRLLIRRQILEALIVPLESLLLGRWHRLEPLDGLRWQIVQVSRALRVARIDARTHGIRSFRLHLLLTS